MVREKALATVRCHGKTNYKPHLFFHIPELSVELGYALLLLRQLAGLRVQENPGKAERPFTENAITIQRDTME